MNMDASIDSSDEENVKNSDEQRSLPNKSREQYLKEYEAFNKWRRAKNIDSLSETVFINYFKYLAKAKAPTSLWAIYSMLKLVMKIKNNVNISGYRKLFSYLKGISVGYKPKKTKVFTAAEVEKFLTEAPDNLYLVAKVALIIGIRGGCRLREMLKLTISDVEKHSDSLLLVKLREKETNFDRSFVIRDEYAKIVERYIEMRPKKLKTNRFLLQYRCGKCVNVAMGLYKLASIPRQIATYLKLKEPNQYTGHCLRSTSQSLRVRCDPSILYRACEDNNVAKSIEESNESKPTKEDTLCSRKRKLSDPSSPSTSKDKSPSPELVKKRSKNADLCNSNAILSGLIDYYCLVCEDLFQSIEDVHQHVDIPHHNNLLQQTFYVEEFTDHRIRKLRKGYFCEYCNEAFTTSNKMRSHVDSETHKYRRKSEQFSSSRSVLNLTWSGNRVVTSQLLIDERPWNGILDDDTCLVCDEEIDSLEDHKKSWRHVLKLAQTKILVGKDELSRKISESLYHCLICNTMSPANDYDKHNTTEFHIINCTKALKPTTSVDNGNVDGTTRNGDCEEELIYDLKVEREISDEINDIYSVILDPLWG